jgi:hypothetical protein
MVVSRKRLMVATLWESWFLTALVPMCGLFHHAALWPAHSSGRCQNGCMGNAAWEQDTYSLLGCHNTCDHCVFHDPAGLCLGLLCWNGGFVLIWYVWESCDSFESGSGYWNCTCVAGVCW